ncbi:AGBL2_3 [Lepeophtheirus salmonis]|uniref:AGBL2_3 n=1 Tax=Lepeophtheirus salmonis TaxID=72036 RepID=A0A7R8H1W3_LEPSM|nr:AGBL2_3 [Lepeophtheirus salmonis]CAF2817228.1 AGBL2_3 [Lepeophtheirus salmonis]
MIKYTEHRRSRSLSPDKKYNRDANNYKNIPYKSNLTLRLKGSGFILDDHLRSDITFSNLKDYSIDPTNSLPRIKHIRSNPSDPELFYSCTGKEPTPRPIGEDHGSLIYEYISSNPLNYFSKSIFGPSNEMKGFYSNLNVSFDSLRFESRFECDLYTSKHRQWFYFQIKNMKSDLTYRFSIVNFSKPDSLYNYGMKPILYSNIEAEKHYIGWTRVGSNIRYYKNKMISSDDEEEPDCRVHPGETPSSWILRGMLLFLSGNSMHATLLRDRYIFKIVPMLNPDGVIVGNTRTSLAGRDLNRQYKSVIKEAFPPIFHVKSLIKRYIEENGVIFYCDLHAHSRKLNVFIYGCENRRHSDKYLKEQIFPLMLHKNSSEKFSFEDCKFKVAKSKESTGRVVFLEYGDYESMGRSFCETLLDFHDPCSLQEALRSKIHYRLLKDGSTAIEPTNIVLSDYSSVSSCSIPSDTSSESEISSMNDTSIKQADCQIQKEKELTVTDANSSIMYKSLYSIDKLHISSRNCRRVQSEIMASVNQFKCTWMQKNSLFSSGIYAYRK